MKNIFLAAVLVGVTALAAEMDSRKSDMALDEKGLIERLHDINQAEVKLGQLAQQKATSQATKDFAKMMVDEHSAADKQLMTLAEKMKIKPATPTAMNAVEKKAMAQMAAT